MAELMGRASLGDAEAIRALEARPERQLSAPEWVALGRGRMELGDPAMALDAYGKALAIEPSLAQDRVLVAHVRQAAGEEATAEAALRLAALRLGSAGADLLYDVWVATRSKTQGTQLAKQLVYSREVQTRASPALLVTLDLRQAESCERIQRLLPRAILHGDTRALRVLQPLTRKQGCGPGRRQDCHSCLRQDDSLENALQSAKRRMEPTF
jgi:tetratricopeptide (TPR) repeat protein